MDVDLKGMCLKLLAAENEAKVQEIIDASSWMKKPKNWIPLDNRETNFNITSNQASDGGKALTELMTNMVDAVLMKAAYKKGVDPLGEQAPKTMEDAIQRLIEPPGGRKVTELNAKDPWLRDFSRKNLLIGITGGKTKNEPLPCYTFVDNGEGQKPENFPTTFLSLSAANKKGLSFVQGKYNMGSSGVLGYCGRRGFKLIVSRRHDGEGPWGWTLIRRRPDDGENLPIAEYLVTPEKEISTFEQDILCPLHTMGEKPGFYDGVMLKTGTVVKLYDYQIGGKFLTFRGAREALNENLVETKLPFRLLDFRQVPKTKDAKEKAAKKGLERALGIDTRPFYGMEFLLLRSHREEGLESEEEEAAGEKKISVSKITNPDLGVIKIEAILLKHDIPNWLKLSKNRVFHSVNGQVQFKETRGYLSGSCRLPALKDRIIILVDATNLKRGTHYRVWKGDRENINNTAFGELYREEVTKAIEKSEVLRNLQDKVAMQELEMATKDEGNKLFQKLLNSDHNLAALLSQHAPKLYLPVSGGKEGNGKGSDEFKGNFSPTFLRLEERSEGKKVVVPINRTRPIAARTDVENGYFNRLDYQGNLIIPESLREKFSIRETLNDGRLTVFLDPLEDRTKIGEAFRFRIGLQDKSMPDPVETSEILIQIVEAEAQKDPKPKPPKPPKPVPGEEGKKKGKSQETLTHDLPRFKLLTKDGRAVGNHSVDPWPQDFTELDGGLIEDLGKGEVIYKINYDNAYHFNCRKRQKTQILKNMVSERYILGMLVLMLGYETAYRSAQESNNRYSPGIEEYADEFRKAAARGAASTVLSLVEYLPKIVDTSSIIGEAEE